MEQNEVVLPSSGRLDKVLSAALGESRSQVARLIEAGEISVSGRLVTKPGFRVEGGECVRYRYLEATPRETRPVDFDVQVLYEDDALMILDKPAGVVVHPAPSVREATLVDWLVSRGVSLSTISGEERHGIVHRLDKETSGILVIAKSNTVHQILAEELKSREMGRYYLAIIDHPLRENVRVEKPIARHPKNRLKMGIVEGGRWARTDFVKLSEGNNGTELIAARLHTGRTHQIRVHLESLGRHILGDTQYGYRERKGKVSRVFLHAALLYLTHPLTGKRLKVFSRPPRDMQNYLEKYFERSMIDETTLRERLDRGFDCDGTHTYT